MFANVNGLADEMKKEGIGRVSFEAKIADIRVKVYFIMDMGRWAILVCDVDKNKPALKFVSEHNDDNFYVPMEYWSDCVFYFLPDRMSRYGKKRPQTDEYEYYYLVFYDIISTWLSNLKFPTLKETNMVDYTELPMLMFGGKRKYFYMLRTAVPKPISSEKTILAFGENMANFIEEQGYVVGWTDRKRKENIEKIADLAVRERWFKCIDEKDEAKFIRYNNL